MARHTLTNADTIYKGQAFDDQYSPDGRRGIEIAHTYFYLLDAPDTADVDALGSASASQLASAGSVTWTVGTAPLDGANSGTFDFPRNVTITASSSATQEACTVTVSGADVYGRAMSEAISVTASGTGQTAAGAKAFSTVGGVVVSASADMTDSPGFLQVGFGDVFGLPVRIDDKAQVVGFTADGSPEAATVVAADDTDPATTTTGDVRGTVDPNTAADGSTKFGVLLAGIETDSKANATGVDQT